MSSELEENLKFETIQEVFNDYKLDDCSILRVKYVLIKVRPGPPDAAGQPGYSLNSSNVIGVISNRELVGPPSPPSGIPARIEQEDIRFKPIGEEKWNEYRLEDGTTVHVKIAIIKVSRTDRRDQGGCPIYTVNSQALIKPTRPSAAPSLATSSEGHPTFVT